MIIDKVYNENCLDTMTRMEDNYIDLTVTSPPYDGLRTYTGYSFDFESIAKELYRVTKKGGVVVWVIGDSTVKGSETLTSFKQALYFKECGFNVHDTMIYQKTNFTPLTHRRYEQSFEYMFVLTKGSPNTFNPKMVPCKHPGKIEKYGLERRRNHGKSHAMRLYKTTEYKITKNEKIASNIFTYALGGERTGHPAVFPDLLAQDHILSWSSEGDLVYDPFMGSGTVAKMAILNNRKYLGSELSEEYCEISEQRVNDCFTQMGNALL